jgi:hypothetical protein
MLHPCQRRYIVDIPKVGDVLYIPSQTFDDGMVYGGKATVKSVHQYDDPMNRTFVEFEAIPMSYNYEQCLEPSQDRWAVQYGEIVAQSEFRRVERATTGFNPLIARR